MASSSPASFCFACSAKRAAWSSGSFSSEKPLAISRPAMYSSKRSVMAGCASLARASDAQPAITERFELYIAGREIANGFSELNDPEDQAARFDAQVAAKDAGDEEAMFKDNDYVRALEYGLPTTAGEGIGIDRLVMLLTDSASIRDVILFPQMRPET